MISAKLHVPVAPRPVARLSARKAVRARAEKNPIEQAGEAVQNAAQQASDAIKDRADDASDAVKGGAEQAKDKADETASSVQQGVQQGGPQSAPDDSAWGSEAKTNDKAADAWFQEKKGQAQPATQAAKEVDEGR